MQGRKFISSTIQFFCSLLLLTTLVACQGYENIREFEDPNVVGDSTRTETPEVIYVPVEDGYQVVTPESYSGTGG